MSKHTPGPWAAFGEPRNIHICMEQMPHIRICFLTSDGPTEANARLIASAPTLLAQNAKLLERCKLQNALLHRYGSHDTDCPRAIDSLHECKCGFTAALSGAAGSAP